MAAIPRIATNATSLVPLTSKWCMVPSWTTCSRLGKLIDRVAVAVRDRPLEEALVVGLGKVVGTKPDDAPRVVLGAELRIRVAADMLMTSIALVVDRSGLIGLPPAHSPLH
jgi:hypothetical protein